MNHRKRTANAARFCQLDVGPIDAAVQGRKVAGDERILVGNDRNRDTLANRAQLRGASGRNRLFAEFDFVTLQFA